MLNALGKNPSGEKLKITHQSPNFKNNSFQNLTPTEVMLKDASFFKIFFQFMNKPAFVKPDRAIPAQKMNPNLLTDEQPVILWFGHSSYFMKYKGYTILVDPVFSGRVSPISFFGKSFTGTDVYTAEDFDKIDLLIITHDHYDHLDYKTIRALRSKVKNVVTSLGVGSHLEHWGIAPEKITELDWWQSIQVSDSVHITAAPARHFSGRSFKRGQTLWSSFVLKWDNYQLYLGGDSGYEAHFKEIGKRFGSFDIAILEAGQYGKDWPYIHMSPEETVRASKDLNAKVLFPVHWAKFELAMHKWDEPIERVLTEAEKLDVKVTTPIIGEPVVLGASYPAKKWWRNESEERVRRAK